MHLPRPIRDRLWIVPCATHGFINNGVAQGYDRPQVIHLLAPKTANGGQQTVWCLYSGSGAGGLGLFVPGN